jgi:replicative DNA helicase
VLDNKLPPESIEAEEEILGGILLDPQALGRVVDQIVPGAYYLNSHQQIYQAALALYEQGKPTDLMSVMTWLSDRHLLDSVGGSFKLIQLLDRTVSAVNIDRYAELVMDKYWRRKLISAGHEIIELGYDTFSELDTVQQKAQNLIFQATSSYDSQYETKPLNDWLVESFDLQDQQVSGFDTGLLDLDEMITLERGELTGIAARPSVGKTWMGIWLANHIARKCQQPVVFFSAEMSGVRLTQRFESLESGIDLKNIVRRQIPINRMEDYVNAITKLQETIGNTIFINDIPGGSLTPIRMRSELTKTLLKLRSKDNPNPQLGLVVLDYIQKLGNRSAGNRAQDVGAIAGALCDIAKDFNVPVVALMQINRESEKQSNKRPSMAQIKDSGDIEQDCDTIVTLYRDEVYYSDTPDRGIMEISVVKNRNGETGTCKVLFDPACGQFRNLNSSSQAICHHN